jgi:hypothetical protein
VKVVVCTQVVAIDAKARRTINIAPATLERVVINSKRIDIAERET